MRRFEVGLFGSVFVAASVVACGGDDVTGATDAATGGRTTGDATVGVTGDTVGDTTGVATGVGTVGGSGGGSGGSADTTAGSDPGTSSPTTMGNDSTSSGSDGGSDTGGPVGPGPVPPLFPGVEDGLCAPPGTLRYCYTGAPATYNVGECQPGLQECVALDLDVGQWGPCEDDTTPAMEVCDGLDNDCNGGDDDGLGTTMCGMGPCQHEVPNCINGQEELCDPLDGAMPETCDGQDNDCDGDIDEGLGDNTVYCGVGVCYHGVSGCEGGIVPPCDPFEGAGPEVCDDLDNDCDGAIDEGMPDINCGLGVCNHTVPSCLNGFPQMCDPFDGAMPEICDGLDNDCDGIVDEDQGMWTCGTLECEVSVPKCIGGVPQPANTCQPIPAGDEICGDGIDNNCDGIDAPCAETFLVGTDTQSRPIDVLWVVDSSGSMSAEMATVEANINNFAAQLAGSGSSTQLHLIADRGTESFEICVTPPLGGGGCTDNPGAGFWQYDTNGGVNGQEMVHSSNAIGRTMQQSGYWMPRLQANSYLAFIFTSDDNGDDPAWGAADGDPSAIDDCPLGWIVDNTIANYCRWDAPGAFDYTSLAYDHVGFGGFATFMNNFFPGTAPGDDWAVFPIIGNTGTTVLNGVNDIYEFNSCANGVENGEEYVKLALLTDTQDSMFSICDAPWDLSSLANDILSGVPNDLYLLSGSPPGTCGMINPATITVVVNGIPLAPADWNYDPVTCVLQVVNNIPVVGDNVVIVYEMF